MSAIIGPNFGNEIAAAGLAGLPFSWGPDGLNTADPRLTSDQIAAIEAVLAAHNPAKPDPNVAATVLLAGGIAITSTGTPALNGTYAIDPASQAKITAEQLYIATTGKFTNGQTTKAWADIAGALHTFPTPAEFTAFAEAIAAVVDAVLAAQIAALESGGSWTAPSMTATIA